MNQFHVYHCTYPNGMKYVGSRTKQPSESLYYFGSHTQLKQDLKSMDKDLIVKEVLYETDDILELEDLELTAIKQHNAVEDDTYYNSSLNTKIAHYGKKRSEETKKKIGIASAKRKHSDETKKLLSKINTGKPKYFTEEAKTKIANNLKVYRANNPKAYPSIYLKKTITKLENGLMKCQGYYKDGNRYYAQATIDNKNKTLGSFGTPEEARAVTIEFKKKRIAELKAELKELQGE